MAEIQDNVSRSGLSELEKIFQDYKSKLENAEKEANEIIDAAWQKAEMIIADKQKETQQNNDELIQKATQEAERIVLEARNKADEIEKTAAEKTKKDAKDRVKKEAEKIVNEARQKAEKESREILENAKREAKETVTKTEVTSRLQISEESSAIIAAAREKAVKLDEGSIARAEQINDLIFQLSQKACDLVNNFKTQVQVELDGLAVKLTNARDDVEMKNLLNKTEIPAHDGGTAGGNGHVKGQQKLNILQPYDKRQIKRLVETLKQVPGVSLKGEVGTEDSFSIHLDIAEPTPLAGIMKGLSVVENSEVQGNTIKIKLKPFVAEAIR